MKYNKEIVELLGFEESELDDLKNVICLSQFVINELWPISDKNENYQKLYPIFSKLVCKIFDITQGSGEAILEKEECKKLYNEVYFPSLGQATKNIIIESLIGKNLPDLLSNFMIESIKKAYNK